MTAEAIIAYSDGSHGLAIALTDTGPSNWENAVSSCANKKAVAGIYAWHLPTVSEWLKMFKANGGDEKSHAGLSKIIIGAGGAGFDKSRAYWANLETPINDYLDDNNNRPDIHFSGDAADVHYVYRYSDRPTCRACIIF